VPRASSRSFKACNSSYPRRMVRRHLSDLQRGFERPWGSGRYVAHGETIKGSLQCRMRRACLY
jgi:hypothetical protein